MYDRQIYKKRISIATHITSWFSVGMKLAEFSNVLSISFIVTFPTTLLEGNSYLLVHLDSDESDLTPVPKTTPELLSEPTLTPRVATTEQIQHTHDPRIPQTPSTYATQTVWPHAKPSTEKPPNGKPQNSVDYSPPQAVKARMSTNYCTLGNKCAKVADPGRYISGMDINAVGRGSRYWPDYNCCYRFWWNGYYYCSWDNYWCYYYG